MLAAGPFQTITAASADTTAQAAPRSPFEPQARGVSNPSTIRLQHRLIGGANDGHDRTGGARNVLVFGWQLLIGAFCILGVETFGLGELGSSPPITDEAILDVIGLGSLVDTATYLIALQTWVLKDRKSVV